MFFFPRVSRRMWGLKALLAARVGLWFLESSFRVTIQELHREVGSPAKAPSNPLLNCSLALTVHLSWATGSVHFILHGRMAGKQHLIRRTL